MIVVPTGIVAVVRQHADRLSDEDPGTLLFPSPKGKPLRHSNFLLRYLLQEKAEIAAIQICR